MSLEQLISRIKRPILTITALAGLGLGTPIISDADEFTYFSEKRTSSLLDRSREMKKGLKERFVTGIESKGKYSSVVSKEDLPKSHGVFDITVSCLNNPGGNVLELEYFFRDNDSKDKLKSGELQKIPANRRFFGEDIPNTHIYLALPQNTRINGYKQRVIAYRHNKDISEDSVEQDVQERLTLPFDDLLLGQRLSKFSQIVDLRDKIEKLNEEIDLPGILGQRKNQRKQLEKSIDEILDSTPGVLGEIAFIIKEGVKISLDLEERKQVDEIKKNHDGYEVYKVPCYQAVGKFLDHTIIGRNIKARIIPSPSSTTDKAYLVIPKISAIRAIESDNQRIDLDGLEYEFSLSRQK